MSQPTELIDEELANHLYLMKQRVSEEIQSLEARIPKYQADFKEDGYPETLAMIGRLELRLANRQVDYRALSSAIMLVESQMP